MTQITKVTYHDLLRETKKRGLTLELDEMSQCYRATCPEGYCFEEGLHEVIAVFGDGIIGNGWSKAEARADLLDRLREDVPTIEICRTVPCDWCERY